MKIGIIGAGFSGTMTAVQLIEKSTVPCEIILINKRESFNQGIAYHPYSESHLLNVTVGKMSAFPSKPSHFLEWLMQYDRLNYSDKMLTENSFVPRKIYGEYLRSVWDKAQEHADAKQIRVRKIDGLVLDLDFFNNQVELTLDHGTKLTVDRCVIATGNHVPRNPTIANMDFYSSSSYFRNPWKLDAVKMERSVQPVLIIGNGLTMADTVLGLLEHGFKGQIYSISPNGLNMLPHQNAAFQYSKLLDELSTNTTLLDLVKLVNKHIKAVRENGISAEPIINSLRPHTPAIWRSLSDVEKRLFMARLRHLWGVARHRIPMHIHDKLQQLRIDGKLTIIAGKITDIHQSNESITVHYFDKKQLLTKTLHVSRVINCTGPESDLSRLENHFLNNCLNTGIVTQDPLKLGICTNIQTFQILNKNGLPHPHLFTLGANLKGELWESTAVKELREQADKLADQLLFARDLDH